MTTTIDDGDGQKHVWQVQVCGLRKGEPASETVIGEAPTADLASRLAVRVAWQFFDPSPPPSTVTMAVVHGVLPFGPPTIVAAHRTPTT